jgi:isopenicillin-N epimerase
VQAERQAWSERIERNPVDFFVRQLASAIDHATERLAEFVGTQAGNLVLVDNATTGMNAVAASVRLKPGDEVLLNDHEYGAVVRIWENTCRSSGARCVVQKLAVPFASPEELVDSLMAGMTARTKLLVTSHFTSPTATKFPVADICRRAHERGVPVCIDGPHAVAMVPLEIDRLDCDFYTASCHKWLCAPFGAGFLYVHPRMQTDVRPAVISWGRLLDERPPIWRDEFHWVGTRDISSWLSIPASIDFMQRIGLEAFRDRTHRLAQYARGRLEDVTGLSALVPDSADWYGSMISMPIEVDDAIALQKALWRLHQIEVPVMQWSGRRLLRISCHAYTQSSDIDRLVDCLPPLLK